MKKRLFGIGFYLYAALCIGLLLATSGCTGLAKVAAQLKNDNASVDITTPWGTFHRSMPQQIIIPPGPVPVGNPVTIETNVSVVVPLRLQVTQ